MRAFAAWVVATAMVLGIVGMQMSGVAAGTGKVQPQLLALVRESPDTRIDVIVQMDRLDTPMASQVRPLGGRVTGYSLFIKSFRTELPAKSLPMLAALPGVRRITLDAPMKPTGLVDTSQLATAYPFAANVDTTWDGSGGPAATGKGVTVAVIDTGLTNSSTYGADLENVAAKVVVNGLAATGDDGYGHGTHVAGIIAGTGRLANGKYIGVAPGAQIVSVKASDDLGNSTEYDLIEALEWVYNNAAQYGIRVVNISATSAVAQGYDTSPLCAAVERVWSKGVVVVVAAGNRGSALDAVHFPPANDPYVITVGAISDGGTPDDMDDSERDWSSRGLTQHNFAKPDVMAPGSRIVAPLSSPTAVLATQYPELVTDQYYLRLGGTSMATPVIAGIVAQMLEVDPSLTPDQVKWILMNTTRPFLYQTLQEPGAVRADAAVWYTQTQTPQSANQGLTPSSGLGDGDDADWDTAYWTTAYWTTAYWTTAYWTSQGAWDK